MSTPRTDNAYQISMKRLQLESMKLEEELALAHQEIDLLSMGPAEAGWWSPETVRAYDKEIAEQKQRADAAERACAEMRSSLERIKNATDSPEIYISGDYQIGLHCGVEDSSLGDRYEGADYGYSQGVERTLEWAINEASSALDRAK